MTTRAADHSWPALAGWFGKIPALGDFVARRLPTQFIDAWDHWLSTEIVATREALGSDWAASYLKAPTWRFALTPGVLDASTWYGVLTPSIDRVGRHFPLTLAGGGAACETEGWWAALLAAATRAREADCDADALDAVLVRALEQQDRRSVRPNRERALTLALEGAVNGVSLWARWQPESGGFGPITTFRGLPQGSDFLKLIVP
ncbi:MAG TPA: type VI secretion system-associated protein TagF [Burkholderiaceae bacterium]|jgi:type VI secretion system protein ImpM|nr:type VI secretion system-associated protein TagF [Burkholderiaceae bacterium]